MRIVWAKETQDDFRRFDEFLTPLNVSAARRAVRAIREPAQLLVRNPEVGRLMDDDTGRRELVVRFGKRGYVIRYLPDHDAGLIRILRVWHAREDRAE